MAGRWWPKALVWGVSFFLHGLLLAAAALVVIDFRRLPQERPYIVTPSSVQASCFLEPELRPRDLRSRDGRALQDDPYPQPCLEVCDTLTRSVPGESADASLRCSFMSPNVASIFDSRPMWRIRYESWEGLGSSIPLRLCRSTVPREGAVIPALRWLARHQNSDGSWSADGFSRCCSGLPCFGSGRPEFDEALTSLALLAFMGSGFSSYSKDTYVDSAAPSRSLCFGETVKKGLQWLMSRQDSGGRIGSRGPKFLYNHAISTLALCEAYGMTAVSALKDPSQKAVDFLIAARNPGAGWRYGVRDGDTDTSVTGWALMAIKSAELAELPFPRSAMNESMAWLTLATSTGAPPATAYCVPESGPSTIPGGSVLFADLPSMTAVGLCCDQLLGRSRTLPGGLLATIVAQPPIWAPGFVDFHYWYFATLAVWNANSGVGPGWTAWLGSLKTALAEHQRTSAHGCENGSWDPASDRWGLEGGRVYATALNAWTLTGLFPRRASVFGSRDPLWR